MSKRIERKKADIHKSLKTNNNNTRLVVIVSGVVCLGAIFAVMNLYKNNNRFVYGMSKDNSLLPLELIEKKELESIFVKGHIQLFMTSFYDYDQWNYEQQIEKALWLVDDSGKELYFFYKNNGHFNLLIQSNSSQSIGNVKIQIDNSGQFLTEAIVKVNKLNQLESNNYRLVCQGKIMKVSQNYPKNPYGYLITNFKEVSKTKIE